MSRSDGLKNKMRIIDDFKAENRRAYIAGAKYVYLNARANVYSGMDAAASGSDMQAPDTYGYLKKSMILKARARKIEEEYTNKNRIVKHWFEKGKLATKYRSYVHGLEALAVQYFNDDPTWNSETNPLISKLERREK